MPHSPRSPLNIPIDISSSFLCVSLQPFEFLSHNHNFNMPVGWLILSRSLCLNFPLLLWMATERHPSRRCSRSHAAGARHLPNQQSVDTDVRCPALVWACSPKSTLRNLTVTTVKTLTISCLI